MMLRERGVPIGEVAVDFRPQVLVASGADHQQEGPRGQEIHPKPPR
jgi:hypothetical protein